MKTIRILYFGIVAAILASVTGTNLNCMVETQSFSVADFLRAGGPVTVQEDPFEEGLIVDLKNKGLTSLEGIETIDRADEITYLDLSNNPIHELPAGIFSVFENLRSLLLDDTAIERIDFAAFLGLTSLTELSMQRNKLKELLTGDLDALNNLTFLNLDNGKIAFIAPGALRRLPNLEVLSLSGNPIKVLEVGVIDDLPNLKELYLSNMSLEKLAPGALRGLPNLEVLSLSGNPIKALEVGAIDDLPNLKDLDLSKMSLEKLAPGALHGLPNLEVLSLSGNPIKVLEVGAIDDLPNLKDLDLSKMSLEKLAPGALHGLPNLEFLSLSENPIEVLEVGAINDLPNLNDLDLRQTSLEKIYPALSGLTNLQKLDLSYTKLQRLPEVLLRELVALKIIYLSKTQITELSDNLIKLIISRKIYTDHPSIREHMNDIKEYTITQFIADLRASGQTLDSLIKQEGELLMLNLNNRGLTSLEGIDALKQLNINGIDLSNNYLSMIPENAFDGFVNEIRRLYLENNHLMKLPPLFSNQEGLSLVELRLGFNKLSNLPDLAIYPALQIINVMANEIQELSPTSFIPFLAEVHLEENKLTYLPADLFKNNLALKVIHLTDNEIELFPPYLFDNLPALQELDLSKNRLGSRVDYHLPAIKPQPEIDTRGVIFDPQKGMPSLKILASRKSAKSLEGKSLIEVVDALKSLPEEQQPMVVLSSPQKVRDALQEAKFLINAGTAISSIDSNAKLIELVSFLSSEQFTLLSTSWPDAVVRQKLNNPILMAVHAIGATSDRQLIQDILGNLTPKQQQELRAHASAAIIEKIMRAGA